LCSCSSDGAICISNLIASDVRNMIPNKIEIRRCFLTGQRPYASLKLVRNI